MPGDSGERRKNQTWATYVMSSRIATPTVRASTWKNSGSPGAVVSPPPMRKANVAGTMSPMVARIRLAAFMPVASAS